jgi:hypothetical protein
MSLNKSQGGMSNNIHQQTEEIKVHEYNNGCRYEGQWRGNQRHGHGIFKWPSGSVYTGEFNNDRRHGDGRMQYADGSEYEGPWRNDARSGRGKFTWKDGAGVYEGDFLDD